MNAWLYQFNHNELYQTYCHLVDRTPQNVHSTDQIPFLPISMFRDHAIMTGSWEPQAIFKSSGTTGVNQSSHLIRDLDWYHRVAEKTFTFAFSSPSDYVWLGLLPSYLERPDSSLINMVSFFIDAGKRKESGFFQKINTSLLETLDGLSAGNEKTILIGVSFALLELFEKYKIPVWENLLVIETGGMKGRMPEITRDELHKRMKINHPGLNVRSEYGMTELLSQAYMTEEYFIPGPYMKVLARDISDPLQLVSNGKRGALNIIDLANLDTCAFIATDDIGIVYADGFFDVLGRLDQSDVRGCNLLYA